MVALMSDELKAVCIFVLVMVVFGRRWLFGLRECGQCDGCGIYGGYPCQACGGRGMR
jgi:hypothetical protein